MLQLNTVILKLDKDDYKRRIRRSTTDCLGL
jgi:hypothetical protein